MPNPVPGPVPHDAHADLGGTVVAEGFARWSPPLHREFTDNAHNPRAGRTLLNETGTVRVWETRLEPGERLPVHRHVLDYAWIALTDGRTRQHTGDGASREFCYVRGESRHFRLGPGQYHLYDVKNIGDGVLAFLTVELKDGANEPLPLPPLPEGG